MKARRISIAAAMTAALAFAGVVDVTAAPSASLTPDYGPVSVEGQDPTYQYRSMPALQYLNWNDAAGAHQRFVRSFQISADDGSLKTRVQYHTGGSLTDTDNWSPALDTAGRPLLNTTDFAKVNNTFRATAGDTVTIDERVQHDAQGRFVMRRATADGGVRWSSSKALVAMPAGSVLSGSDGRIFQRIIRLPGDNSLVVPYYAAHAIVDGAAKYAAHLLVSNDEGASWRLAATVFKSDVNTYSESSVARRADRRMIMITRYDVEQDGKHYAKLAYRVTAGAVDTAAELAGASWGPWTSVIVPGAADYPAAVQGVAPVLHTMDQGVLMLLFGRPRNKITFSYDGGSTCSTAHSFYDNIPTSGCPGTGSMPCSSLGSSGYLGVAVTSARTAYVLGDNCHTSWGRAGDYQYPHGRDDKLWFSTVVLS